MKDREWWRPIKHFTLHTLTSSAIFIIIALPAAGLFALITLAETAGVSRFVVQVLTSLEYVILLVDALLFIVYLVESVWDFIEETRS